MTHLEKVFTSEFATAPRIGIQVAIIIIVSYWMVNYWPEAGSDSSQYVPFVFAVIVVLIMGLNTAIRIINYHIQINRRNSAHQKYNPDDARLATEADLEAINAFNPNKGIPVGKINGRPFFFPFTHSLVVAPAGTSKTIASVVPAITHGYRIPGKKRNQSKAASRIIMDLKREHRQMTARLSRQLHQHRVVFLDPADPKTDAYNLLDPVIDALEGRLPRQKTLTLAGQVTHMLEPEPQGDEKNRFWREGGRDFVLLVIVWLCLFHPKKATLPEVSRIVRDPNALLVVLEECAALIDNEDLIKQELGIMASDKLAQEKQFDDFRTGASLAVKSFSPAGELAGVTAASTFRWADTKKEPLTIYVCANLSESRVFKRWLTAIAEAMMMELEYFPGNVPVHICLEEATNIGFDLSQKLTALRAVGARVQIVIQERSEAKRIWGEHATHTIQGEVDLEQYFGISDVQLAEELEKRLGTIEVMKESFHTGAAFTDQYTRNANHQRKPLMSAYHLQYRMKPEDQIVFLRGKVKIDPIYCQKLTYDDVREWIDYLDDNPVEGGKLQGPPTIRIAYDHHGAQVRKYKRINHKTLGKFARIGKKICPPLWASWACLWLWVAVYGGSYLS